jgi:serine protease
MTRRALTLAPAGLLAALALAWPGAGGVAAADAEAAASPAAAPFVPGEVLVKVEGEPPEAVELPEGIPVRPIVRLLNDDPDVAYAVPNYVASASWIPNDPGTSGRRGEKQGWLARQWNFLPCGSHCGGEAQPFESAGGIDALGAWANLARAGHGGAAGIKVAVLDTGIAYRSRGRKYRRSPDFDRGQFVRGRDYVHEDRRPLDDNGHGTHVAGTIAEKTNNALGVTGLAFRAKLMPVRVLNRLGNGQADDISRGIRFAARNGADVINMSFNFGCGARVPTVVQAIRYAHRKGAVVVASVGNWDGLGLDGDTRDCIQMPASAPWVIGVGGTTEGACLGEYSRIGADVDLVAPGGGFAADCTTKPSRPVLQLTFRGGTFKRFGLPRNYVGTSMSAAHVSGVAAMVLASRVLGPDPAPTLVTRHLKETSRDLGAPGMDPSYGRGLIDAAAATAPSP